MIGDIKILERLVNCFEGSFINSRLEFIADKETNLYFILGNCENELDVKCKILEWFSRDAYKSMPYRSNKKNQSCHEEMDKKDIGIPISYYHYRLPYSSKLEDACRGCKL